MGTLVQGWNRMDRRIEVSTSLHATPLWAPSCKKIVLLTLSQHRTPNHPSGCALTALCALGFTSGDGTSIDDGWSEAVVNKRSVWTLRRLRNEEETKKRCLSLYKGPAPERPTFPLPLPVRLFFRIDFWKSFFLPFFWMWVPAWAPFCITFPLFWHHFFEHGFCINVSSILGWILKSFWGGVGVILEPCGEKCNKKGTRKMVTFSEGHK